MLAETEETDEVNKQTKPSFLEPSIDSLGMILIFLSAFPNYSNVIYISFFF